MCFITCSLPLGAFIDMVNKRNGRLKKNLILLRPAQTSVVLLTSMLGSEARRSTRGRRWCGNQEEGRHWGPRMQQQGNFPSAILGCHLESN